jgi:D-alanyl-lipoteichoic acid acyltransferase DltB (MBOAT superfamily)
LVTITIDYSAGIYIEKTEGRKRKSWLVLSIVSTCLVLFVFKYYNFFNENIGNLAKLFHIPYSVPALNIILPIGLSFHTFQSLSYVIEVYRGHQKAEKNFGIYSLYVMFYPQLVAGPIERPQNLLHQFYEKHKFDYENIAEGLKLMLWGLFKKIVIADRLSLYVNAVYNHPEHHSGLTLILATIFFAVQIYCDFSGYSNIAIGAARVMGFKLMTNFNRPYFSKSISEFWKRWHISLSTWFKDYLYISLGGNRVSVPRWYFNLFFVFLVSGLWHGANLTFVIWGAINGIYLILETLTSKLRKSIGKVLPREINTSFQIIVTFILTCFAWIFFRANTLTDAVTIIQKILTFKGPIFYDPNNPTSMIYSFFGIMLLLAFEIKKEFYKGDFSVFNNKSVLIRNLSYSLLIIMILLIGVFDGGQFIYFQF